MTEFLFVRHAEAAINIDPTRIGGQSIAAPLTEKGQRQAGLLGDYLGAQDNQLAKVFSSGAVRTDTTARIALERAGIAQPVIPDARLLEISQGEFEGKLRSAAYTPENIDMYDILSKFGKFPGGESIDDAQQRMLSFVYEKTEEFPDKSILIFSHGLAIRALAGMIKGFDKQQIIAQVTDNVSTTSIVTSPSTIELRYVGKNVIPEYT